MKKYHMHWVPNSNVMMEVVNRHTADDGWELVQFQWREWQDAEGETHVGFYVVMVEADKPKYEPSPEMRDAEPLVIRRCVVCCKVLGENEGRFIQCVRFCDVCGKDYEGSSLVDLVGIEGRLSTEEKGGVVCSKCEKGDAPMLWAFPRNGGRLLICLRCDPGRSIYPYTQQMGMPPLPVSEHILICSRCGRRGPSDGFSVANGKYVCSAECPKVDYKLR